VPRIASSLAYGIGDKAEVATDKKLQFEIGRADVALTAYDFVNNKLVFKAQLPDDFSGVIREIGLFSLEKNALAGDGDSRIITTFDSGSEAWTNPSNGATSTFTTTNTRVGTDSLRLAPAASATVSALLDGIGMDFSENSSADRFTLALFNGTGIANVKVDLMTDLSNYYTITYTPGAGYVYMTAPMSAAVLTGAPSWSSINMIRLNATGSAGGGGTVDLDGLRLEDTDTPNPEYVMVSRELLSTPFVKEAGRSQAIEFAIDISIT
jgi:hypothetical protein